MFIIMLILLVISVMISVAFLTLLEQKLLSYIQIRKGPNKSFMIGVFQPFSDALKLFTKQFITPLYSNYFYYYITPVISLTLSLFIWLWFPFIFHLFSFNLNFLFLLSCMSLGVYFLMISGWSSNSNYALLGSLRAIAQTVSYEVCMIMIMLFYIMMLVSLNLNYFLYYQKYLNFFFLNMFLMLIMIIILLAETNRAPFDFAEGESELVSGFNVEYSSGGFALIFLSEYSMILLMSFIFTLFFMYNSYIYLFIFIKLLLISFFFIWVRGSYPRFRYDMLMFLSWKIYLPISLLMLMFIYNIKLFFFSL